MKNFWILFCFFLLAARVLKAQDTLMLYQVYASFSDPEKAEWTAFQNNWNYFDYSALKEKHRVRKLDCKSCESFYAEVLIEIDENGKTLRSVSLRASHCGLNTTDSLILKDFEDSVTRQHFTVLKNKRFIARLGQVLKC